MLKNLEFTDTDIEDVTICEHNLLVFNVELLIKPGTDAILLYKDDVEVLARHFGLID